MKRIIFLITVLTCLFSVSVFAESIDITSGIDVSNQKAFWALTDNGNYLLYSDTSYEWASNTSKWFTTSAVDIYTWNAANNGWELYYTESAFTASTSSLFVPMYCNQDIMNRIEGTVFFTAVYPKPVVAETAQQLPQTILADSSTLLVLGIGLMGLMMGLNLLPRIFYKFL